MWYQGAHSLSMFKKLKRAGGCTGQISHVGSPTFTVSLCINHHWVSALIDTGASVSCVKSSVLSLFPDVHISNPAVGSLSSANGQPIPVVGTAFLPFRLNIGSFSQQFQVVDALA